MNVADPVSVTSAEHVRFAINHGAGASSRPQCHSQCDGDIFGITPALLTKLTKALKARLEPAHCVQRELRVSPYRIPAIRIPGRSPQSRIALSTNPDGNYRLDGFGQENDTIKVDILSGELRF